MRVIFCAVLLALGALPLIHALFMDMYGKAFQMELLDDCNIYVYDHVLDSKAPTNWCKRNKSSMNHHTYIRDSNYKEIMNFGFYCVYVDDDNIVQVVHINDSGVENYTLFSQDYLEADFKDEYVKNFLGVKKNPNVNHISTTAGKYFFRAIGLDDYDIDYISTSNKHFTRALRYILASDEAVVFDSTRNYTGLLYWSEDTKVRIDPNNPKARICTVDDSNYTMHPIKTAIETACARYDSVKDFSVSFPQIFATMISDESHQSFAGMIETKNGTLISSDQKVYDRPPIENNYTEIPFFFYSSNTDSYSPFFLYYKFDGPSRDFTVRFVYEEKAHTICEPLQYMQKCNFQNETVTVAAAPKMLKHDQKSISFEVYFLVNNANLQYCIFRVDFDFDTKNSTTTLSQTDDVNAYVHVQSRSKRVVNCDHGNRTVRWLLAYTEQKNAELVSLDNDVSSPIFPCSHCGNETLMYCDVNPEIANEYYSAVYLITGGDILFVGVKSEESIKKIEYFSKETKDKNYFLQELNFTLSLDDLYYQLHGVSPVDGDEEQTTAYAPCYLCMPSVLFLILMTCNIF